jgi:hypothetical protein
MLKLLKRKSYTYTYLYQIGKKFVEDLTLICEPKRRFQSPPLVLAIVNLNNLVHLVAIECLEIKYQHNSIILLIIQHINYFLLSSIAKLPVLCRLKTKGTMHKLRLDDRGQSNSNDAGASHLRGVKSPKSKPKFGTIF